MPGSSVECSQVRGGLRDSLAVATTVDEVARQVVNALCTVPGVVRAGLALPRHGGRVLRFCSRTADGSSTTTGQDPQDPVTWCEIDGLADVPLVRAVLSGRPVPIPGPQALRVAYPHLADRQERIGVRAMVAVPLGRTRPAAGALLLCWGAAHEVATETVELLRVADAVMAALDEVGGHRPRHGLVSRAQPASPPQVVDLRDHTGPAGTGQVVVTLPGSANAPLLARRFLRDRLDRWSVASQARDDTELCLSEIVTNAVIHSGTATEVTLWLDRDRVRVVVRDGGGQAVLRHEAHQPDPGAVGGRGLTLVEHLAHTWSYEQNPQGTTVSFEVLLPQPPAGASTVSAPATTSQSSGSAPSRSPSA